MKKIIWGITLFLILMSFWYLFIKKYDYQVTFKEKTAPGTVFQGAISWSSNLSKSDSIESEIFSKKEFSSIVQRFKSKDSKFEFEWSINGINDSITQIKVGIVDTENSLKNRIKILFSSSKIVELSVNLLKKFKGELENHLKKQKVSFIGEAEIPEMFCAYIKMNGNLSSKAQNMIGDNAFFMEFLNSNNIKIVGKPFIEVNSWDIKNQLISYNFCFPVEKKSVMPEHRDIKFKTISKKKSILALYNGNYRTSDRAWFYLYDYALRNNIKIENTPLEIFYDNPFIGGDELNWKTEVFMPIKK